MGIVVTYICDVTGKSGINKAEFVKVSLQASTQTGDYFSDKAKNTEKLVHIDVAKKLNLVNLPNGEAEQPEVTFEGKLKALLEDHVQELVEGHLENFSRN